HRTKRGSEQREAAPTERSPQVLSLLSTFAERRKRMSWQSYPDRSYSPDHSSSMVSGGKVRVSIYLYEWIHFGAVAFIAIGTLFGLVIVGVCLSLTKWLWFGLIGLVFIILLFLPRRAG